VLLQVAVVDADQGLTSRAMRGELLEGGADLAPLQRWAGGSRRCGRKSPRPYADCHGKAPEPRVPKCPEPRYGARGLLDADHLSGHGRLG